MLTSRIEADYLLETSGDPRRVAELMAGEQSSGTFVAIPGETAELKERVASRVERLELLEETSTPSLPSADVNLGSGTRFRRAHVTLSWPLDTIGPSLPNLLATVAGNLFELKPVSGLRLLDVRLPREFG
jgi:ribulose-bisphosphate carboxylase large chain